MIFLRAVSRLACCFICWRMISRRTLFSRSGLHFGDGPLPGFGEAFVGGVQPFGQGDESAGGSLRFHAGSLASCSWTVLQLAAQGGDFLLVGGLFRW